MPRYNMGIVRDHKSLVRGLVANPPQKLRIFIDEADVRLRTNSIETVTKEMQKSYPRLPHEEIEAAVLIAARRKSKK